MATNDFLPWAIGGGANVETQASFIADPAVPIGVTHGTAISALANKVWRQSSIAAFALGQIVVDLLSVNAADDGTPASTFLPNLKLALTALCWTTGDVKLTYKTVADSGWVLATDGTIGSPSSGANFANTAAQALYILIWNNVSNTFAPVNGGRGASAILDFQANKAIALPKVLARALAIAGQGAGLTFRGLGQALGEEVHQMVLSELAGHAHTYNQNVATGFFSSALTGSGTAVPGWNFNANGSTGITGSGVPFNVMQPTAFMNMMVKL